MRNKDTGEFELVVGNGQLVSGFFIVVLLFAVGVAMGYILGQNSEKSAKNQQTAEAAPCVATDTRPQPASQAAPSQPPATAAAQPSGASDAQPQPPPTTQPAREPEPPPSNPAPPKPAPQKTEAPKPEPPKSSPPPASNAVDASEVPSGFFWQVSAKSNLEAARAVVKILKERGFPAYLTPGPKGLTRVLVGPYKDTTSKAKAKTDLENMGFPPVALNRD